MPKNSSFVGQVANLRPIVNRPLVGQPILAAAAFQAALSINVGQTLSSVNPAIPAIVPARWVTSMGSQNG